LDIDFSENDIQRYARHILLAEVGGVGQAKLLAARVLVVGAGGLGCPLVLYLAAAGVGTIGIVDDDRVSLSNLQRQIAHSTADIGAPKVVSAASAALAINPGVVIRTYETRLSAANVGALLDGYDIICDGTDNFAARYLLADACFLAGKTLISAAVPHFVPAAPAIAVCIPSRRRRAWFRVVRRQACWVRLPASRARCRRPRC
jgi:molybdopterin/thiamine biosynthesis adenylyltransferase